MSVLLSALPAVAGVFGAGLNFRSQRSANLANVAMQRETNALNYQIFKETMAYNSPENQAAMMRKAGLNPILAAGSIASGNKANPIQLDSPRISAAQFDIQGPIASTLQFAQTLQNIKASDEAVRGAKIENDIKADALAADLDSKLISNQRNKQGITIDSEMLRIKQRELELSGQTVASDIAKNVSVIQLQAAQIDNLEVQKAAIEVSTKIQKIALKYANARNAAELNNLNLQSKKLIEESANLRARTTNEQLQSSMGGVELSLALATYEANRKFVEARTTNAQLDPYFRGIDGATKISNAIRSWTPGGGATLGVDKFTAPRGGSPNPDSHFGGYKPRPSYNDSNFNLFQKY